MEKWTPAFARFAKFTSAGDLSPRQAQTLFGWTRETAVSQGGFWRHHLLVRLIDANEGNEKNKDPRETRQQTLEMFHNSE